LQSSHISTTSTTSTVSRSVCWFAGRSADMGAPFRHSGTTRTRSYDMDAAFMLLQDPVAQFGEAFVTG